MVALWSPLALILLVVYCACPASQDMDVLDHMVSEEEATLAATNMNPQPDHRAPGCVKCSYEDIYYCMSYQVLEDHCCCDKRYLERFPYVPHACYLSDGTCSTIASNCEEYVRIKVCCCDLHTGLKWKALLSTGVRAAPWCGAPLLLAPLLLLTRMLGLPS